jgi:hypothetical protein
METSTQKKIREWQLRRLDIKEQMQLHPEKTLELSKVLDLMDEEHAAILNSASVAQDKDAHSQGIPEPEARVVSPVRAVANRFDMQLRVTAETSENLFKLLEMAMYELKGQIDVREARKAIEKKSYPGSMSGTLGDYQFELLIDYEAGHE